MSLPPSLVPFTHFGRRGLALSAFGGAAFACAALCIADAAPTPHDAIRLELKPRLCTLSGSDKQCRTEVHASWQSNEPESLCLIVLEKPEVKRCWENYSAGTYSIELVFADDLDFQLRDPSLQDVLASQVLQVIREAILYRHKRREPWNVFE
jgi:Protein of unknown function (DUF3019)